MNKLLATMAVLTVIATPAFAQGYDPANRTGAAHSEAFYSRAYAQDAASAYAQQIEGPSAAVRVQSRNEEIRLDHAKGEI